ncbi:hypothetical protein N9M66_00050 [Litoreibacter sp.]|nr:hypothetical protein [Litoreibacter sp.]
MRRFFRWTGFSLLLLIMIITGPIMYVETMCRGDALNQRQAQYITETRLEARTYLVYPEWHIVYAYEGYAEALRTGHPHHFPYIKAITGFWSSLCGLTEKADQLGDAGFDAKSTIYTIGASFTLEMLFKAAYEETIGRIFTLGAPSPQDRVEADMADDYATFLQQVPWYKYDFPTWSEALWAADPVGIRGWERRIALGLEWGAKAQYAKVIAKAAAGLGADELTMQIAVKGLPTDLSDVIVLSTQDDITIAQVPRYRIFTTIAQQITNGGGQFIEIAGNDDILISYLGATPPTLQTTAQLISATTRVGFAEQNRYLIATKVTDLSATLQSLATQRGELEHIYDY